MILSALIHKNPPGNAATLPVAIPVALKALEIETVAKVATVTVANAVIEKVVIDKAPSDDLFFAEDRRHCA